MSRDIDPNKRNLSASDKQYLQDRGILPRDEPIEAGATLLKDLPNTGDANTVGWTTEALEAELEKRRAAEAEEIEANEEVDAAARAEQGLETERSSNYAKGWTDDERREELEKRGLSTEGSRKELVKRLRESDGE